MFLRPTRIACLQILLSVLVTILELSPFLAKGTDMFCFSCERLLFLH